MCLGQPKQKQYKNNLRKEVILLGDRKFDFGYLKKKTMFLDLQRIFNIVHGKEELDGINIKKELYCPECKTPQLVVKDGDKRKYLSTAPNQKHAPNCSYTLDELNKKELEEYVKKSTKEEIAYKLAGFFSKYNFTRNVNDDDFNYEFVNSNFNIEVKTTNGKKMKRIPIQKLGTKYDRELEEDIYKYYYGQLFIQNKSNSDSFLNLSVKNLFSDSDSEILQISFNKSYETYFTMKNDLENFQDGIYNISFFGKLHKKGKYYTIYINKPEYIYYEK